MERPAEHQGTEGEGTQERHEEGKHADGHARLQVLAKRIRVDLRPGQKGEDHGTQAGQEVRVRRLLHVMCEEGNVAGHGTDDDLDQRGGDPKPNADQRRRERHPDPHRSNRVHVHRARSLVSRTGEMPLPA